ncbi:MAG: heme peroxidase [Alphaproteobacteria bacterium]|nr:heme peroxidase [Alphaproteobacteria bacterium]
MPTRGQQRDTSRDGFRNKVEATLLSGLKPFWGLVNVTPWLARIANRLIVNNAVMKAPCRPLALSTQASYTNWSTLSDRTWFSRYLPAVPQDRLPPVAEVATLFKLRPERPPVLSDRSSLLFPSFAQWFTDGFLMTDQDRRRTRTNHQIDLSQLYGLNPTVTAALRRRSEAAGEKGKLKSVTSGNGEWAPPLYDATGRRDPAFALVPEPTHLPGDWPIEKRAALFAFGGERANSTAYTAAIGTLFLREHNRLCTLLERNNPGWDDERVFQTARNINIVLLIKLVVEEYINHISPYWMKLLADPSASYTAPWNRENWIPVEFNLLYRWHSLVPTDVKWGAANVALAELRFDNRTLLQDGLVTAFASASQTRAWRIGMFNTTPMLDGVEMASIQQGRDNRLASYNDYREVFKYPRVTRFEQISSDPLVVSELRRIYVSVDQIEYFVGLFAEELAPRSAVPPLIGRMVGADAFSHALTNPLLSPHVYNAGTFTPAGMEVIERTSTLADLLARNDMVPAGTRISMEAEGYQSVA